MVTVAPGRYGARSFEVWLSDRAGHESNHLSGDISFVPDDSGRTWTQVSALPARALAQTSGSTASRYVAVGAGGLILTSQDGSEWTQQPSPVTANLHGIAWSGSRFVAVGASATVLTSEDGYSWTVQPVPVADTPLYAVSWGGGAFVAVGGGLPAPVALRSIDGTSWTQGTGLEPNAYLTPLRDASWGSGRWVAVGQERWASPDGETWSRASVDYTQFVGFAVAWNGAQFVTVGVQVGVSSDGLTWTMGMSGMPAGYPAWGLAWSGYHWLMLGTDAVSTSADGTDWGAASLNTTSAMSPSKVIWDGDWYPARYVAAVGTGIWTSP